TDFSNYFTEPTKAQQGYRQVFEKGFVADYPLTIKHKNGNLTDVLYNASVYKDDNGNVLGVFAAARDITEQKWAKDLRIANKELAFQNEEKEKRAAELINANKELESFTYISSHDLQEPLRKIQIFATRLIADESKSLSDRGKEYVLRMQDAANRMQVLITDLLAYSRTTTSERKFETSDLNEIIESVKKDFAETIAEKKAIIKTNEMCDADIIPFQFRQLMHNIIGNSLKFSKPDLPPQILIKSRIITGSKVNNQHLLPEKDYCHITITDNGIGFEPKYKDHIFELFKRLHDKEKTTGTGIGLTIVKKIVENHNGVITAASELNKGATFDIYIPST
ncbi:MAG: ATP-binding protein, partial [Ferruginibacter sp.]